ncbi:MAG: hypothetical protein EBV03_07275 [Proteobacteria bacterium]|nr:hypothetical protein [Pseudomonadota bacterium]
MLFLPYKLEMGAEKLLIADIRVTIVLLALLLLLIGAAVGMDGFPYPGIAVIVTLAGLLWSLAGFVLCVLALYPAVRRKLLRLWGIAIALNGVSLYVFFSLAAMY